MLPGLIRLHAAVNQRDVFCVDLLLPDQCEIQELQGFRA